MSREDLERLLDTLGLGVPLHVRIPDQTRHAFIVLRTVETGFHSGRPQYLVACKLCGTLVHEGTTSPWDRMDQHARGL